MEAACHSDNSFVTLTYSDEHLPLTASSEPLPTLNPRHLQLWLKLLRKEIAPLKIRYYATGEYGDVSQRPHYHLALFNFPTCLHGLSRYTATRHNCCYRCDLVRSTWGKGQVYLGGLTTDSAHYIAGYVTKKLTAKSDPRLLGRHPEFGRMSLKPGIGADFVPEIASTLLEHNLEGTLEDVPAALQHGSRQLPLGRYIRRKLREQIGRSPDAPQATLDKVQADLQPMRETAFNASRSFKTEVVENGSQAVLNMETKQKIFSRGKKKL